MPGDNSSCNQSSACGKLLAKLGDACGGVSVCDDLDFYDIESKC